VQGSLPEWICYYGESRLLVWFRAPAVLGVSVLLMGSKLIIHMPEGGSVVSSSGLFACDAGETCTIAISEHRFAETFTAVPEAGYTFSQWENKAGAVCRGSYSPHCEELDSGPLSGVDNSATVIHPSGKLSLRPSFRASGHAEGESGPRFTINSHQSTRYYPVRGNSREEVWSQLTGPANPLTVDRDTGTKPLGHASFKYQYDYQSEYAGGSSDCRVESANFEFRFETVLPRLAANGALREELESHWSSLQDLITEHEAGHHAIYRQLVTQLPQALEEIGTISCAELSQRVDLAVAQAVENVKQASADYDAFHGAETFAVTSL
jgi:predicted secreted Zn-dependent protease